MIIVVHSTTRQLISTHSLVSTPWRWNTGWVAIKMRRLSSSNNTNNSTVSDTAVADGDADSYIKKIRWRFLNNNSAEAHQSEDHKPTSASVATTVCNILFVGPHFHAALPAVRDELQRRYPNVEDDCGIRLLSAPTQDDLYRLAQTARVALPFMERLPADFFDVATSPHLQLVQQYGVGLEGIDVAAATQAGVAVSNIPAHGTGNAQATSEHAVWLAISLLRHATTEYSRRLTDQSLGGLPIPRTLYGKSVTVVGFGAVGKVLAQYLVMMGADVTVVRRKWSMQEEESKDDEESSWIRSIRKETELSRSLPSAQLLFLACPLTPDTLHFINDDTLGLLPHGALVVNVARGGLVEYHSMLRALKSGVVGGFASDVGIGHPEKPSEPWDPHDEMCHFQNVIFTPHVGGYSDYSYRVMAEKTVDAITRIRRGEPPPVWVNRGDSTHLS